MRHLSKIEARPEMVVCSQKSNGLGITRRSLRWRREEDRDSPVFDGQLHGSGASQS